MFTILFGAAYADQDNSTTVELDKTYSASEEWYFYYTPQESGFYYANVQDKNSEECDVEFYQINPKNEYEEYLNNGDTGNYLEAGITYYYYIFGYAGAGYTFKLSSYEGISVSLDKEYKIEASEVYNYTPDESGIYIINNSSTEGFYKETKIYYAAENGLKKANNFYFYGTNDADYIYLEKGKTCYFYMDSDYDEYSFKLSHKITALKLGQTVSGNVNEELYEIKVDTSGVYKITTTSTSYLESVLCETSSGEINSLLEKNGYENQNIYYFDSNKTYYLYETSEVWEEISLSYSLTMSLVDVDKLDENTEYSVSGTVCYSFTPTTSGVYAIDINGAESSYYYDEDTDSLYYNECEFQIIGSNNDSLSEHSLIAYKSSVVTEYLTAGTTYYIIFSDDTYNERNFNIKVYSVDSRVMDLDKSYDGSGAYSYTPETSGYYSFNTKGASTYADIYCLDDNNELQYVAGSYGNYNVAVSDLNVGTTYYFEIHGENDLSETKASVSKVNSQIMEDGKEYSINQTTIFTFTPSERKDYVFQAEGSVEAGMYCYYNYTYYDNYEEKYIDDERCLFDNSNYNYNSIESLDAGTTYYLIVKYYGKETGGLKVKVSSKTSGTLTSNKSVTVNGVGLYVFKPTTSGFYTVTTSDTSADYYILYKKSDEYYDNNDELVKDEYFDTVSSYGGSYYLTAGTTYYLQTYLSEKAAANYTAKIAPYSKSAVELGTNYKETADKLYTFTPGTSGEYTFKVDFYRDFDFYADGWMCIYEINKDGLYEVDTDYDYEDSTVTTKVNLTAGTTYYVATKMYYGIDSYNLYISINLKKPTVTLSNASKGVKVSWTKSAGASGYYVYRKAAGDKKWTRIKTVTKASTLTYTDTTAKAGTTYYYTVKAYAGTFYSSYVTNKAIKYLKQPTVTLKNASKGVKVTWSKTTGATGYIVYRKTAKGTFTAIKTITSGSTVSYTDTTAKAGTTYYYTVRAYAGSNKTNKSSYVTNVSIKYLKQPTVTLSKVSKGVKVAWSKITGASGYYVYRKASGAKSWTLLKKITSGSTVSYTDTKAKSGTTYYYTVKAYSGSINSSYVTNKSIKYKK
jgi:hypothetical protein